VDTHSEEHTVGVRVSCVGGGGEAGVAETQIGKGEKGWIGWVWLPFFWGGRLEKTARRGIVRSGNGGDVTGQKKKTGGESPRGSQRMDPRKMPQKKGSVGPVQKRGAKPKNGKKVAVPAKKRPEKTGKKSSPRIPTVGTSERRVSNAKQPEPGEESGGGNRVAKDLTGAPWVWDNKAKFTAGGKKRKTVKMRVGLGKKRNQSVIKRKKGSQIGGGKERNLREPDCRGHFCCHR